MKIAIISEFNPFHNGHKHLIDETKKAYPNAKIFAIMSGDFVQRGDYAIYPFCERSKVALENGIDQVIELPMEYSTQAAHIFAEGAIKIAHDNGIDMISFGSESGNTELFNLAAKKMNENIDEYNLKVKSLLKSGKSFPNASAIALEAVTGVSWEKPNDILGFEYIKQIVFHNYKMDAFTIKRIGEYKGDIAVNQFLSATAIRQLIKDGKDVSKYVPSLPSGVVPGIETHWEDIKKQIIILTPEELSEIRMVDEGIEMLFKRNINSATDLDHFIDICTSKRYTSSRIRRTLLMIHLKIKK